jgi:hypothetical protein
MSPSFGLFEDDVFEFVLPGFASNECSLAIKTSPEPNQLLFGITCSWAQAESKLTLTVAKGQTCSADTAMEIRIASGLSNPAAGWSHKC